MFEFVLGLIGQEYERVGGSGAAPAALFIEERHTGAGASGECLMDARGEQLQCPVHFLCGEKQALDAGQDDHEFI